MHQTNEVFDREWSDFEDKELKLLHSYAERAIAAGVQAEFSSHNSDARVLLSISQILSMFKFAQIIIINKIDLTEAVEFELDRAIANIHQIAPQAKIFQTSAKTGRGIDSLLTYLTSCWKFKTLSQLSPN